MGRIAIVGNIASGKSSVEKILEEKGYTVFDTDKIAHKILENNPEVEKLFGTTDRKVLGSIVLKMVLYPFLNYLKPAMNHYLIRLFLFLPRKNFALKDL